MALNISQFAQTPVQGMIDLTVGVRSVISVQINSGSAGGLVAGQPVKIVNTPGGIPDVIECSAATDDVFGFLAYDIKDQAYNALDKADIAFARGAVMYMTSSAAIAANAKVMIVVASPGQVATATTGNTIIGRAIDEATASGQLIRVLIDLPGVAA